VEEGVPVTKTTSGRNGRPPLCADAKTVPVNVRLSASEYDAIYARARQEGTTIPALIRRGVEQELAVLKKLQ
jgi:hypothetical protein